MKEEVLVSLDCCIKGAVIDLPVGNRQRMLENKVAFAAHRSFTEKGFLDIGEMVYELEEIGVFCNDTAVSIGGIPSRLPGCVSGVTEASHLVIIVNRSMMQVPKWQYSDELLHQMGHIAIHGYKKLVRVNGVIRFFSSANCKEVDEYLTKLGRDIDTKQSCCICMQ